MAKIIPAHIFIPDDVGDDSNPPILVVEEHAVAIGNLIAEHGVEIQNEDSDFIAEPGPEPLEPELLEPESKQPNGFRKCMSEQLLRPPESEPLTQLESRHRFREAAQACKIRRQEEAAQQDN